ncbi:hypothetical protein GLOIN_2v1484907 [Rhizophagus irregularis DAOM 181602=DAOM 197198]|nr:hypothetical protein GLOIN_2v1484907 [Rhizophagus irregularis DAOM 181602=DAOM 197198]
MFHFYKKWTYMKYIDHVCRKIPKGAIQEELLREACMIFCLLSSTRKSENAIRGCKETGYQKNSGNLRYQHSGDQSSIIFLVPRKITSLGRFIHGLEINWYTIGLLILYVLVKDIDNHVINSKMFVCVIVERHKTGSNTHFLWMVLLVTENIKNIANDNFYEHFLNDSYQKLVFVTNGQ